MLKIVLDTNMFLSAILYGGMVEEILHLILAKKLQLFASPDLKKEVLEKLKEYGATDIMIAKAILFLEARSISVTPNVKITVCRDPEDNFMLELVETAQVDYLLTRDKDLLDLREQQWKKTTIIRPEEFLPILRKMKLLKT